MSTPGNPSPPPVRVLVADDHEWIREIAVQIVRQTLPDATILVAADGVEALRSFQEDGADFVVTNHHMPHMDGADLIRALRQETTALPILMISINASARTDAESAGANWFLTKEQLMEYMPPLLLRTLAR